MAYSDKSIGGRRFVSMAFMIANISSLYAHLRIICSEGVEYDSLIIYWFTYMCECYTGASLAVYKGSQTGLALDDAVWYSHLTAEGGQEEHELRTTDIVKNKSYDMVEYYSCFKKLRVNHLHAAHKYQVFMASGEEILTS